jgi:GTP cyclohydrolase II
MEASTIAVAKYRRPLESHNPKKMSAVEAATIVVEKRVQLVAGATFENERNLQAKAAKLGHLLAHNIKR